ncbi:MAG: ribonuclease HI [Polyangiaceae bacterium]|nr:ribonuclease HI [Polyangiaceae bacterium]
MAWRYMCLRGSRVLARCDERGQLALESGKVEIRYRPNDGRAYHAAAGNLEADPDATIFPDTLCAAAEAPAARGGKTTATKKPAKAGGAALPSAPSGSEVLVYADGACRGNPGPAGLGVVMLWDEDARELSEYLGHGTNNIAELTAILRAAEAMPDPTRPLHLYTDSSYAIGVLSKGWKAKANQELVAETKRALSKLSDVQLRYVPGHAGVLLNERADALAVEAVRAQRSSGWVKKT